MRIGLWLSAGGGGQEWALVLGIFLFSLVGWAQTNTVPNSSASNLTLPSMVLPTGKPQTFIVPLPAHAQPPPAMVKDFHIEPSKRMTPRMPVEAAATARYLLPEDKKGESITPEMANLNLSVDTVLISTDTGEKITLPAGTYRQIIQFPIDSPMIQESNRARETGSPPVEMEKPKSRYARPSTAPIWVRYESLEKISIDGVERRGGLDLPSHGPADLGPRVWYAKSETADWASSAFYFVFGGLGYGMANLGSWAAGNTREIPRDFEYRLMRK